MPCRAPSQYIPPQHAPIPAQHQIVLAEGLVLLLHLGFALGHCLGWSLTLSLHP